MNVSDLYGIVRELREVTTLQANLLDLLNQDGKGSSLYKEQQEAYQRLIELLKRYEQYNI